MYPNTAVTPCRLITYGLAVDQFGHQFAGTVIHIISSSVPGNIGEGVPGVGEGLEPLGDEGADRPPGGGAVAHRPGFNGQGPRQLDLPARAVELLAEGAEFGGGHLTLFCPSEPRLPFAPSLVTGQTSRAF